MSTRSSHHAPATALQPGWSQPSPPPVVASDKLFFWLFQHRTQRLQPLAASLLADMEGYTFSAPVIKEREVRLDGLFLPPPEQLHDKPALIMEAQMAADSEFFLRLYNGGSLFLRHQFRQGQPVRHWRVLVICPSRDLNFGDPLPVAEFPPPLRPSKKRSASSSCQKHGFQPLPPPSVSRPPPLPSPARSMT